MAGCVLRARERPGYFNRVASAMVEVPRCRKKGPLERGGRIYLEKVMPKLGLEERTVGVCQEKTWGVF